MSATIGKVPPKPRKPPNWDYQRRTQKQPLDLAAEFAELRTRTPNGRG